MQFSEEQIKKAIAAKSAEELLEMAKAEGFSLTEEEAAHYYKVLHTNPSDEECIELSEEEQENVAGGSVCFKGSTYSSDPPYFLITTLGNKCPSYDRSYGGYGLGAPGTCGQCRHMSDGITLMGPYYCHKRKLLDDPYN